MIARNFARGLQLTGQAVVLIIAATFIAPHKAAAQFVPDANPLITPGAECVAGTAAGFACENVDLLAIVPSFELSYHLCQLLDPFENPISPPIMEGDQGLTPMTGSDMWGWTTTDADGKLREFALQGLSDAVAFVEVTDPADPKFLGCMTAPTRNFLWRDLKVYNDHIYVVGDFSPELALIPHDHDSGAEHADDFVHGLQIMDLKRLLTADPAMPKRFIEDSIYAGFDEAHNIVINPENGFAAGVATDTCGAEFHMLDLSADPLNPTFLGCYNSNLPGAVHDAQCITYQGPDQEHRGKEICLAFMEDQFSIFDMTDPENVVTLAGGLTYPGQSYVHQGWFTDDFRYIGSNDELDELDATTAGAPHNTRTYMWDARDLDNPRFIGFYEGPTGSIDHNMYFKGQYLHQANYTAGYRVLDAKRIGQGVLEQVAFFDTNPPDADAAAFGGVWSGYFHFESGAVALSQLNNGELFILQPHLPEPPPVDDDDHDSDDRRDDEDSDDDNDGKSDDSDSDDDNDGKKDDEDSDDDNDGIDDEYDSKSSRDKASKKHGMASAGQSKTSTVTVDANTALLIAAVESASADMLSVEIHDPNGMLVATSVSAPGRAIATVVPLAAGDYTLTVTNKGDRTAQYKMITVMRGAW